MADREPLTRRKYVRLTGAITVAGLIGLGGCAGVKEPPGSENAGGSGGEHHEEEESHDGTATDDGAGHDGESTEDGSHSDLRAPRTRRR